MRASRETFSSRRCHLTERHGGVERRRSAVVPIDEPQDPGDERRPIRRQELRTLAGLTERDEKGLTRYEPAERQNYFVGSCGRGPQGDHRIKVQTRRSTARRQLVTYQRKDGVGRAPTIYTIQKGERVPI